MVDGSAGKIKNADKAMAQLNAARSSKSVLNLKQQIGLSESGLRVAEAEGATPQDLEKRTMALAKLREELARTQRIVADAKPITPAVLTKLPAIPTPEIAADTGKEAGSDFAESFFDGASAGFAKVEDLISESVRAGAEVVEVVLEQFLILRSRIPAMDHGIVEVGCRYS